MRKRILLLTTGGTIASTPTAEGLAPGMDGQDLARRLPFLTDRPGHPPSGLLQHPAGGMAGHRPACV